MQHLTISGDPVTKLKLIGEGNFSQVFLAESKKGKIAAIKKVKKSAKDKTAYQLAKKEATILTGLHSPHVLELLDTYEEHNYFYLIEKFYKGQTLESILKKKRSLTANEAQKIFRGILQGVQVLVSKKIVHRDLKPSNIIVNDSNEVFLIDFGFACKFEPEDEKILTERFGTPYYMSPEVLARKMYNSKSDIWSLGVIYYEMLCGFLPYSATSDAELLKSIKDPKNDIFKVQKYIPEAIKGLIRRCLTIDADKRIGWAQLLSSGRQKMSGSVQRGGQIIYEQTSICLHCCNF